MKAPYSAAVVRRLHEGLLTQQEVETMPEQWLKVVADARERERLGIKPAPRQRQASLGYELGRLLGVAVVLGVIALMGFGLIALGKAIFGG